VGHLSARASKIARKIESAAFGRIPRTRGDRPTSGGISGFWHYRARRAGYRGSRIRRGIDDTYDTRTDTAIRVRRRKGKGGREEGEDSRFQMDVGNWMPVISRVWGTRVACFAFNKTKRDRYRAMLVCL